MQAERRFCLHGVTSFGRHFDLVIKAPDAKTAESRLGTMMRPNERINLLFSVIDLDA